MICRKSKSWRSTPTRASRLKHPACSNCGLDFQRSGYYCKWACWTNLVRCGEFKRSYNTAHIHCTIASSLSSRGETIYYPRHQPSLPVRSNEHNKQSLPVFYPTRTKTTTSVKAKLMAVPVTADLHQLSLSAERCALLFPGVYPQRREV